MSEFVNCSTCKTDCVRADGNYGYTFCGKHTHPPMTNADRIRSMSDEELSDYLRMLCRGVEDCADCHLNHEDCPGSSEFSAWITWLQQPAEGGQK